MPTATYLKHGTRFVPLLLLAGFAHTSFAFDLTDVTQQAQKLASHAYQPEASNLSPTFAQMQFADYQKIQFRDDRAYWGQTDSPFKLEFYHQGMQFNTPVRINEITPDGNVQPIRYQADYFNFNGTRHDASAVKDLGFAGFKILYPVNTPEHLDEAASFLGASYFRIIGPGQIYGLSARGLAINTGESTPEEFPKFKAYWIERPAKDSDHITFYALMDSPSATGAYRFTLYPDQNKDAQIKVESRIYMRHSVKRLGIAPLTSMFLFGPNQPSITPNFRPALHDSNGLAMHTGKGEWIWRPLENPRYSNISSFGMTNPRGFGLLQRGRDFHAYEDLKDRYDLRPSAWIEPQGHWGKGRVALFEMASPDETNDNMVAFWMPDQQPAPSQVMKYDYIIHFSTHEERLRSDKLGYVMQTMRTPGHVYQKNLIRRPDGSTSFLIDFAGDALKKLAKNDAVKAQVSVGSNAQLMSQNIQYNPVTGGRRLDLRIKVKDPHQPVEMRANLAKDGQPITETWSYLLTATE
ncbi:glucan biosynthesis protein G [Celerinatantimonas sp. YJH-8]|uniref:glucan biosynthesis protein G n=1 Tax=Celerinatantimonas sp. YJH-8 TaxID=3228714 RepID=UPI0038C51FB0